jgi:hypothetical protein
MFPYFDKIVKLSFQEGNKLVDQVQKYFLTICTTLKIKRWMTVYTKVTGDLHLTGQAYYFCFRTSWSKSVSSYKWPINTNRQKVFPNQWVQYCMFRVNLSCCNMTPHFLPQTSTEIKLNKIFLPTQEISWHGFCLLTLEHLKVLYKVWIKMGYIYRF